MFWTSSKKYLPHPFAREADLETAIIQLANDLFGDSRIYLDVKRLIGNGSVRNIPDGYLIDLSSSRSPSLYVVENELASHDPLRHIAVQILQFSLSFESSPSRVKAIVKEALAALPDKWAQCEEFARVNGFENVDFLLETMIFGRDKFRALVVIDECVDELETVLVSRFRFPVEILTLERYGRGDDVAYRFSPFLADVLEDVQREGHPPLDPAEIDTVVVPAHDDGFQATFLGENRWYSIRLHSSMIPRIKYIAVYRVRPVSAITHIAPVESIEPWKDTGKYVVNFLEPAEEIGPIELVRNGRVNALQNLRYTTRERLLNSGNLDDVF